MTRDALAETAAACVERFRGVGAEQYQINPNLQRFETEDPLKLLVGMREEVIDLINYGIMVDIQMQKVIDAVGTALILGGVMTEGQVNAITGEAY